MKRRNFLRGLGVTLALPRLEAQAKGRPPARLVCMFLPNGVFPAAWNWSQILEPLAPHRADLSVLSNLDNPGKGHVQLTASFLTAVPVEDGRSGVSLDQMVAQVIGRKTAFPSLVLGTEPPRQGGENGRPISLANTVSWSSPTVRVSPEINPRVAFDRLFRPAARHIDEARKSVLDVVLDDARALRRQVSRRDGQKVDEYLDSVRAVERRVETALRPPSRSWVPPTMPSPTPMPPGIPRQRDEHLRLMLDLIVLALQTDTTRVATLVAAHGFSRQAFPFLDGVTTDHHSMSHHRNQAPLVAQYTRVSRWYSEQLAYLLTRMKAVDEGTGSLLDSSVVLYGSDMKDGNLHVRTDLPIVLAGRGAGLRPGRDVVLPKNTPLANLHLTIARKLGVAADTFNRASTGTLGEIG